MIEKQVLQLILLYYVGTDVSASRSLIWDNSGVPRKNPCVQVGAHHTLSLQPLSITEIELGSQRREASALSYSLLGQRLVQESRDTDNAKCSERGIPRYG